jgi:ABC-2 type transport system permease protein
MRPTLFFHVALLEARTRMTYRVDFWINAIASFLIALGVAWFLWDAMFRESGASTIGGYDLGGMTLYYVAVILAGRLVRGPELLGSVSHDIYEGALNRYLLFPADYFGFKYAQALGSLLPAVIQFVLLGGLFLALAGPARGGAVTPLSIAMAVPSILVANLLYFTLSFPIQAVAFWADNVWSLGVALRLGSGILGGALLPLSVFPPAAHHVLDWLPFRFLFDQPVAVLTGQVGVGGWLEGLALCLGWILVVGLIARAVWRRGSLQYSGIGI